MSVCQSINGVICYKLVHFNCQRHILSQWTWGLSVIKLRADAFRPSVCFFLSFSTGLPTHSNYLSVPADTQPHLAFCVHPHTSLLVWWSGDDRVKFDGEDEGKVITGSLLCGFICVVHHLSAAHVLCTFFFLFFFNVWDGTFHLW